MQMERFIYIRTRTYLISALIFLAIFTFIMARYVAPYSGSSDSIERLKSKVTGLPIAENDSARDNLLIVIASAVLGISIVYLFLRVVSAFMFVVKE